MSIRAELEGNSVTIDGGNVKVTKDSYGKYEVKALDFHTVTTSNRYPEPVNKVSHPLYDPHYYANGHNGLTVAASVMRALKQVRGIVEKYDLEIGKATKVTEVIERMIVANKGRDKVYSLAGRIAKDMVNDVYVGVPFSVLFDALESGEMQFPDTSDKFTNGRYRDKIRDSYPYTYSPSSFRANP